MAQNDGGKVLWFVAGAALGASVALLYAPQSGRDTRRIIQRKSRAGREALADSSRDLMDKGRELFEKGQRVADDAAELFERGRRLVDG
jgi:gas vesicle protein